MAAQTENSAGSISCNAIILRLYPWAVGLMRTKTRFVHTAIITALDKPEPQTIGN